jgi:EF-P beta-lysylation protein EpmB
MELSTWKSLLRLNITSTEALACYLELSDLQREQLSLKPSFVPNVPIRLAQKMAKGSLDDPLVLQFLPLSKESIANPAFCKDPVGDALSRKEACLLHKYEGRVLLICTSACAMHCRYCFRQNFSYEVKNRLFSAELEAIKKDPSIREVILSGGDPLSLPDHLLQGLFEELEAIPHVTKLRFHTRFPIGIPERIDASFLHALSYFKKQIYFVIHSNHPRELDEDIFARLAALRRAGCILLNQSVLLKGVNDDVTTLQTLCELLVDNGILPYYLHQLDRVEGAGHFEVQEEEGIRLIRELAKRLPGYAVPRYVREIAGEPNKMPII